MFKTCSLLFEDESHERSVKMRRSAVTGYNSGNRFRTAKSLGLPAGNEGENDGTVSYSPLAGRQSSA